ncbi:S8 family serine peptidase [Evansella tamaricis]
MKEVTKKQAEAKVENTIMKDLEKSEYVEVLIELTEQVDTTKVAAEAKQKAGLNATDHHKKMTARYAVVDSLQTAAKTTQEPIIATLEKAKEAGDVKEFQSFYIMNVISVTASKEVIEKLSYFPEVASIKENALEKLVEPVKGEEPPVIASDDSIEWNIERVQAPDVWDTFGVTGEGIVVGVIDTGVQWDHPALKDNFRGYNPEDPDNPDAFGNWYDGIGNNSLPFDTHGHGTHVTGTVMGQEPTGDNKIGVAPGAQWIAASACSSAGCPRDALLAAGEYMLAPEGDPSLAPDIVQNSWGSAPGIDEWYRPMVTAWRDAGQLPVFSAGNDGPGAQTVTPPANYPESYAIAATDSNDIVASFSSRGPANYSGDQKPNLSAPGVSIRSSVPGSSYEGGPLWSGTSMASPHVSGVAALLLSIDASLSPDELEEIMNETATPLTDSQYTEVPNDGYGMGLVNAFEAVSLIADGTGFISGQVLTDGSDEEPPTIEHHPIDFTFSGLELPITATITDNVAVLEAEVILSHETLEEDISIPLSRVSGDHLNGNYQAVIPPMYSIEPGFEYQILAHDFGGNTTATDTFFVEVQFGIVPGEYSQDFEDYPLGWEMNGSWEWGEPSGDSPDPVVGSKVIGTNLSGNYPPNAADLLLLPPMDLRDAEEASLRLNHWYDIEAGWDYGFIGISTDLGETWELIDEFSARDQEWRNLFIDLNPYAGSENPIFVAFELVSDGIIEYTGWYLDNVELVGEDTEAPDAPTGLEASSTSTGINLSWNASIAPDTNGYNIYRTTTSGSNYEMIGTTAHTEFTDNATEAGLEYFYVVTAFDYSDNESDYSNEVSGIPPAVEFIFHTDFDSDNGGFTTGGTNNSWEWGVPTSGPGEAYSGESLWATNLSGSYNNNEDSWIMSPEIELSADLSFAELNFTYWQNIENNWDFGYVEVTSDNGSTWDTLESYTNVFENWNTGEISLDSYIGETIQFRFALDTDGSVTRPGWYIDDVYVLGAVENGTEQKPSIQTESTPLERVSVDTSREKLSGYEMEYVIQKESASYEYKKVSGGSNILSSDGLPVSGTVTILETNRTTNTNPLTGEYTLRSGATEEGETVTVRAEAYGFYPEEVSLSITEDETTYHNFILDPLPSGNIEGTVTNQFTEFPVADASIRVVEDPLVPSVTTNESGNFLMENIYEGDYTLHVTAQGYHPAYYDVTVEGGEVVELNISLEQFIGYEDEIAYDNGIAENALVLNAAGNGLGVKFSPDGMAEIRGVNMFIWGSDFPSPGGNEINIVVYDTDENGNPNERVIGPVPVEVERGDWNYIDLTDYSFTTDRDFYITTLQDQIGDFSPAVGTDEEFPNAERSYLYINGAFEPHFDNGNFMIRANVAYALQAPEITSPEDGLYTSEDSIDITGEFGGDGEITVYNNGEETGIAERDGSGPFTATISLSEGENEIFVQGDADGIPLPSNLITVIKDSIAPEITIESPSEGSVTNAQVVDVAGFVADENLSTVSINGTTVDTDEDGAFSQRLIVDEGENTFTVEALDLAGNSSSETVTIFVDWTDPTIENIEPSEDVTIAPGESVTVSFTSDSEGGEASFRVTIPSAMSTNSVGTQMVEVEPGVYEGTWTAPDAHFENAVIEITMTDAAGNTASAVAGGTLSVIEEEPMTPQELEQFIDELVDSGEIPRQAGNQLGNALSNAEKHYSGGRINQAINQLELFLSRIDSNHMRNVSDEVKETLREAAEALIEEWSE